MNTSLFQGHLVRLAAPNPEADAEAMSRWQRDAEFLRLLDSEAARPLPVAQNKTDMEAIAARENSFAFMIRTLADDRVIGFVGLIRLQWTHGDAWLGIGLGDREYWGKGCGTDALRLILRYGFAELNLHRVSLGVFEYNPRAVRSYEKAGFVLEGRTRQDVRRDGRYWDSLWMGILREEWERQNPEPQDPGSKTGTAG
jgi:RimJ/RimL family protein N-acetyltransferase